MKRIPIAAAQRVAEQYGYDQVIIIARKIGEDGGEHVTTYGVDKANCDVAGRIGSFIKSKIMEWPDVLNTLVVRFLMWPLPKSVRSDQCVTMDYEFPRSGTNLLTADEAKQMVDYLLAPTGGSRG